MILSEREQRIWDHVFMNEFSRLFCYRGGEAAKFAVERADQAIEGLREVGKLQELTNSLLARIEALIKGTSEAELNAACQKLFDHLKGGVVEPRWDLFERATDYYRYRPRLWEDDWNRRQGGT